MKFVGSTALILLVIIIKDVLLDCPESGCECGNVCLDRNNRWCNNNKDTECSCVKGCVMFDHVMQHGDIILIYCQACWCPSLGIPSCNVGDFCLPDNLTLNVDYPEPGKENPNCNWYDENDDPENQ